VKKLLNSPLFKEWKEWLYLKSQGTTTPKVYERRLKRILESLEALGVENWEEINAKLLYQAVEKHSPVVAEQSAAAWQNFRKWARLAKDLELPDVPRELLPKPKEKEPRPLSKEEAREMERILREKAEEEKGEWVDTYLAFLLMLYGGLRIGEVLSLTPFNFQGNSLIFRGKGRKERTIPLEGKLSKVLDYLNCFPLFRDRESKTAREMALRRRLKRVSKEAGIKEFTPHRLRHTFGTMIAEAGFDAFTIKELLGHSSIKTSSKYVKVSEKRKREAVRELHKCLHVEEEEYQASKSS